MRISEKNLHVRMEEIVSKICEFHKKEIQNLQKKKEKSLYNMNDWMSINIKLGIKWSSF